MSERVLSFQDIILDQIKKSIIKLKATDERITIMLTGGRSAELLYKSWSANTFFSHRKITYYFGDERCVLPNHLESNYGMAVSTLFPFGLHSNCKIERMKGELIERDAEAQRYSYYLPDSVDILLLSVGADGHIASLFPGSNELNEIEKSVVPVVVIKPPFERLTITPKVINSAKNIIVMAAGEEKGLILAKALEEPDNINELPVRLTIGSTWILDKTATLAFKASNQQSYHNTRIIYV